MTDSWSSIEWSPQEDNKNVYNYNVLGHWIFYLAPPLPPPPPPAPLWWNRFYSVPKVALHGGLGADKKCIICIQCTTRITRIQFYHKCIKQLKQIVWLKIEDSLKILLYFIDFNNRKMKESTEQTVITRKVFLQVHFERHTQLQQIHRAVWEDLP